MDAILNSQNLFLADSIGMIGSLLLIVAFTLCVLSEAFRSGARFLLLNMLGSILLLPSGLLHHSIAAVAICSFWIVASIAALLNRNRLSQYLLYPLSLLFTAYTIYQIYQMLASPQTHLTLKISALMAVELFVISYSLFIGRIISTRMYLTATLVGNAMFIPCLFIEDNISSLALQTFCLLLSVYGLIQESRAMKLSKIKLHG
ncbi:MAG: hypothetical protein RSG77_14960 [Hafnia sp.]